MRPTMKQIFSTFSTTLGAILLSTSLLFGATAQAQSNNDELVKQVTEAVLQELKSSGQLSTEIDAGIKRFIVEQQQAKARGPQEKAKNARAVDPERDHLLGNPDAEITLIEYSDFECPFCKRFHPTAMKIVADYDGEVNWVYRHFPLAFHNPGAQKQAEASICASEQGGNDAFWAYANTIFERTKSNGKGFPIENLIPLAVEQSLNEANFKECLDSERYKQRVLDDYADGVKAGVTGTPGNILRNNKTGEVRVLTGAVPYANVKAAIEQLQSK